MKYRLMQLFHVGTGIPVNLRLLSSCCSFSPRRSEYDGLKQIGPAESVDLCLECYQKRKAKQS